MYGQHNRLHLPVLLYDACVCSQLDTMDRCCLDILIALERRLRPVEEGGVQREAGGTGKSIIPCLEGGRAMLFARFLAEEWDVDCLSIFLYCRERVQMAIGVRFRDVAQSRIWDESLRNNASSNSHINGSIPLPLRQNFINPPQPVPPRVDGSSVSRDTLETGSLGGRSDVSRVMMRLGAKVVPYQLPSSLRFVEDRSMPETPLVSFKVERLLELCGLVTDAMALKGLLPEVNAANARLKRLRQYLYNRVLARIASLMEASMSPSGLQTFGSIDDIAVDAVVEPGIALDGGGTRVVPAYTFILQLCDEWMKVPPETKMKFGSVGLGHGSLARLTQVYADDGDQYHQSDKMIANAKLLLSQCEAQILKTDKLKRRLERRWQEEVATAEELEQLQEQRLALTKLTADR